MKLNKLLYRVDEVTEMLSLGKSTFYELLQDGEFECHNRTPGKRGISITARSIVAYVERHIVPPEDLNR